MPIETVHRHRIKRADRLLGNPRLHAELPFIYAGLARSMLGGNSSPTVLVDWTDVGSGRAALVAAVPVSGRAIPIYTEVHTNEYLGNGSVQKEFLRVLHDVVLPDWCRPVIVTDAGFGNDWFKAVLAHGWDYVGRLRSRPCAIRSGVSDIKKADRDNWTTIGKLHHRARTKAQDLGAWTVALANPLETRLVALKSRRKRRKGSKKVNRRGVHPGSSSYKKYQKRALDPWILATSLSDSAEAVVLHYKTRMRIEEMFRDAKSHRFGWSFEDARCRLPKPSNKRGAATANAKGSKRLEVLLLIAALGMLVLHLIGLSLERSKRHLDFQANSIKSRRVLSLFTLGLLALGTRMADSICPESLEKALRSLRSAIANPQVIEAMDQSTLCGDP